MNTFQYACDISNVKGCVLEFGVYRGDSLRNVMNAKLDKGRKVFGFDSFEGLPEDWSGTVCNKGFFSTEGNIPVIEGVKFYKGWFENSIPQYLNDNKNQIISVLHVDCDLYSSTKTVLYSLNEFIVPGTIICFDEWIYRKTDGAIGDDHECKCFHEWVKDCVREFEFIEYNGDTEPCAPERKIVKILK